jgi:hypothetical protein
VLALVGVVWALYTAARELFRAGERILIAFASLLAVLVRTLPSIALAGLIALGGAWLMNHLDNNLIELPVASNQHSSSPSPAPATSNSNPPTDQSPEKHP